MQKTVGLQPSLLFQGGAPTQCTDPQLVGWCIFEVKFSQYIVLKGWSSEKNSLKKLVHCTKKGGVLWRNTEKFVHCTNFGGKNKKILKKNYIKRSVQRFSLTSWVKLCKLVHCFAAIMFLLFLFFCKALSTLWRQKNSNLYKRSIRR